MFFVGIIKKLKSALFGPDIAEAKSAASKVEPAQTRTAQVAPEVVPIGTVPPTERKPSIPAKMSPVNSTLDSENGKVREYLSAKDQPRLLVSDKTGKLPVTIKDGYFVYVPTGQLMPPANRVLAAQGVISFRVRGTQHHHGAKSADTSPGQPAILRREPNNKFDPSAVAVYALTPSGRLSQVGYANKGLARSLAKRIDAGEELDALFMRGDPPGEWEFSPCVVVVDEVFCRKVPGWPS